MSSVFAPATPSDEVTSATSPLRDSSNDVENPPSVDVVDLTSKSVTEIKSDGSDSSKLLVKHLRTRQLLVANRYAYRGPAAAAEATTVDRKRTGLLKPNSGRTAEVIKVQYIRTVQQYRKICSLIDLLVAQQSKLDGRRRQLQRAMDTLSKMYRINKLRSVATPTGNGNVTTSSAVSSSTSLPLPPLLRRLGDRQVPGVVSVVNPRCSTVMTADNSIIDVDFEIDDNDFEPEILKTTSTLASATDMASPWCAVEDIDEAAITEPEQHNGSAFIGRQSYSPSMYKTAASQGLLFRYDDPAASPNSFLGSHCHQHRQFDYPGSVMLTAAHCKSNSIDIDVPDYERPAAAHTRKADLSSYSYMQLSRQRRNETTMA